MTDSEYLLVCLGEEAGEVQQAVGKSLRFGLTHYWPDKHELNKRELEREIAQLIAVAEMLGLKIRDEDKVNKIERVLQYRELSKKLGILK